MEAACATCLLKPGWILLCQVPAAPSRGEPTSSCMSGVTEQQVVQTQFAPRTSLAPLTPWCLLAQVEDRQTLVLPAGSDQFPWGG